MSDHLLSGPEPGPDELRAIVSRASKRRWRTVGVAAVVALAAGGGIGYGLSDHGGGLQTVVAGSPSSGSNVSSGAAAGSLAMPGFSQKLTRLFVRDANGVTIRGYRPTVQPPVPASGCYLASQFLAEASTRYAVGQVFGVAYPGHSSSIQGVEAGVVGVAEQDPVYVVTVNTSPGVTEVKMSFTHGGTDQMAPVQSWAALAAGPGGNLAGSVGTLQALGAGGRVLQTMTVNVGMYPLPQSCACAPIASGNGTSVGGPQSRSAAGGGISSTPALMCPQPAVPRHLPDQTVPAQGG